jgi:negative regulator of replication initiation
MGRMPRHTNAVGKTRPIRVDEEVYQWLQSLATPLVDTPNDVLRRLMLRTKLAEAEAQHTNAKKKGGKSVENEK